MLDREKLLELSKYNTLKEISRILGVTYSTICYNCKKYKIIPINKCNCTLFDYYTPESCYWAGFIAADGNVFIGKNEYRVSIKSDDLKHLEKFKNTSGVYSNISINNNICYIQIFSKHIVQNLIKNYNIIPNKSLVLQPPPSKLPKSMLKHYLRGYFDGNGHIGYNGHSTYCNFNIACSSKCFIDWVSNILKSFNLTSRNYIYKKRNCFYIDINNKNSLEILNWIYSNSEVNTRLDRKYEAYCNCRDVIHFILKKYEYSGIRSPSGCKGFDLDYNEISKEYMSGSSLDELASKYNISKWTLISRFKKLNIRKSRRYKFNKKIFANFSPDSCYWAGFIAADGWIDKREYNLCIELSIKDIEHLNKFKKFLSSDMEVKIKTKNSFGKEKTFCYFQINSVELIKDLKKNFNIISNKSLTYKPPKLIPKELIRHFIRGYIDGDGSIGWHKHSKKPRLNICSGSKELLDWIFNIIKQEVDDIGNPAIKSRKNLYSVEFIGNQTYNIFSWLYKNSNYYLYRKYEVYKSL